MVVIEVVEDAGASRFVWLCALGSLLGERQFKNAEHPHRNTSTTSADRTMSSVEESTMPMFERFRNELDEHHDRRERIIKASRDVTALSKKM